MWIRKPRRAKFFTMTKPTRRTRRTQPLFRPGPEQHEFGFFEVRRHACDIECGRAIPAKTPLRSSQNQRPWNPVAGTANPFIRERSFVSTCEIKYDEPVGRRAFAAQND